MNKDKVFYLHIPKTAGTTFNRFLETLFSQEACAFHIESHEEFFKARTLESLKDKKVLSGHITLHQARRKIVDFHDYAKVVILRDPYAHISSHLRYVRRLGDESEVKRLKAHTPTVQKIVEKLCTVDMASPEALAEFIAWLEVHEMPLFHNTQVQYLLSKRFDIVDKDRARIKKIIDSFDYVGVTETLDQFMQFLSLALTDKDRIETNEKLNSNERTYGLNLEDKSTREVLYKLVKYDAFAYEYAKEAFNNTFQKYLKDHG